MAKLVLHHKDGREIKFNNADFKVVDSIVVVSENIPDEMFGGYTPIKRVFRKDDVESIKEVLV